VVFTEAILSQKKPVVINNLPSWDKNGHIALPYANDALDSLLFFCLSFRMHLNISSGYKLLQGNDLNIISYDPLEQKLLNHGHV
jgi:hypothetical protein